MIELDEILLGQARRLITGANVHRINTLIFCYEQAVSNQRHGLPYNSCFELSLRDFVVSTRRLRLSMARKQKLLEQYSELPSKVIH